MKCCKAAPRSAAGEHEDKQPHQHARQRATEVKAAVQQNQREAEKSEPQVAAHPGLRPSDAPDGEFLAQAQQAGEQHEGEADDAVSQAEALPPRGPCGDRRL